MNPMTQHKSGARRAGVDPFAERPGQAKSVEPLAAGTARRVSNSGGTEAESGYGCVDWYLYPHERCEERCH
jgi:hypothetical protein